MQFTGLRLVGFKSFVEPTELTISPGMTGIVGPNGCGKSNLVEALRWVMGENSARNMRGGGMEDVIFSGSATRPARNQAEVQVLLDNSAGVGPPEYGDEPELAVSRKIVRDHGSDYRINGASVRARDVQLLFADMATGARSTAIVSQGRVSAFIGAKPTDRRLLLEEAAGITGLHSRRHEAELRLRAAENNLTRLDDVTGELQGQLGGLKKQARQAERYRKISTQIRQYEAMIAHLRHQAAAAALIEARTAHEQAQAQAGEATRHSASVAGTLADQAAQMTGLRDKAAETAAALSHLTIASERLDAEEARLHETLQNLEQRVAQSTEDLRREEERCQEAVDRLGELDRESADLSAASEGAAAARREAAAAAAAAARELQTAEAALAEATENLAARKAGGEALARRLSALAEKQEALSARAAEAESELAATGAGDQADAIEALAEEQQAAVATLAALASEIESAEEARAIAEDGLNSAAEAERAAQSERAGLTTEMDALTRMLATDKPSDHAPVIDMVTVTPGHENAFATALGDSIDGALADAAPDAPAGWREVAARAGALPKGATPLTDKAEAPAALAARLAATGLVESVAEGDRLAAALQPGQRLVSPDGDLWRWDGYRRRAGEQASGAIRLAQQNRLSALQEKAATTAAAVQATVDALTAARAALDEATALVRDGRERRREVEGRALQAAQELETLRRAAEAAERQRERLATMLEGARAELAAVTREVGEAGAELAALPALDGAEAAAETARGRVAAARTELDGRRRALAQIDNEHDFRRRRLDEIARDHADWLRRRDEGIGTCASLTKRRGEAVAAIAESQDKPADIAAQRQTLLSRISDAEEAKRAAATVLAEAEAAQQETDRAARSAEAEAQRAREEAIRREADVTRATEAITRIVQSVREALDCTPEAALTTAGVDTDAALPPLADCELRLERVKRERENMGPVNLRAEIEANEVQEKLDTLTEERADLEGAIGRLRQAISGLNREARSRLLAAFGAVNENFGRLFSRVFGGGEARLALTEADDPLQAGLEIMASPPGKRMQILTLLSGGEQALTATALLFAVFLANPAPICVLDEIDAPLDDANTGRLTELLDELARRAETRFLVITHNPITMASMDRLFGVTMAERGVSQLVSVDLQRAATLREVG